MPIKRFFSLVSLSLLLQNPHRRGWVEISASPTFPEPKKLKLYVFFRAGCGAPETSQKLIVLYTPYAHCLFCMPGTETRLWHSFKPWFFKHMDYKPNPNWQMVTERGLSFQPRSRFSFVCSLRWMSRTGAWGSLSEGNPASSWINTASRPESGSRSDSGFDWWLLGSLNQQPAESPACVGPTVRVFTSCTHTGTEICKLLLGLFGLLAGLFLS